MPHSEQSSASRQTETPKRTAALRRPDPPKRTEFPQRPAAGQAVAEDSELQLDSSFYLAFEMTHRALKAGLSQASDLSITQYRTLVKLQAASPDPLNQTELGRILGLKANVVTQAVNALEAQGLVARTVGTRDGRSRLVTVTDAGENLIDHVNAALVDQLYTLFPTEDASYRSILEASIAAGALIDPPISHDTVVRYPASRALVSLELIRQATEQGLREACGASYTECRIMQRLGELGRPLRIVDLSDQLDLSAVNIARTADKLAARGWVQRMRSSADRKAVFLALTAEGEFQCRIIDEKAGQLGRDLLWSRLSPENRRAVADVGQIVIAGIRAKREARRDAALESLEPIARPD